MTMRILLADDHELTRRGMRALLESVGGWRVIAEASDGIAALRLIEEHAPDVAVVDMSLPGLHGVEVLREGRRRAPNTAFIVLSMHADDALVARAMQNGALGYVLKGSNADDLMSAIEAARRHKRFLSEGIHYQDHEPTATDRYDLLTHREREVLHLTAEGRTSPEIADRLFISPRTVEKHRENLMAKLGLRNQSELVRFAIDRGLI